MLLNITIDHSLGRTYNIGRNGGMWTITLRRSDLQALRDALAEIDVEIQRGLIPKLSVVVFNFDMSDLVRMDRRAPVLGRLNLMFDAGSARPRVTLNVRPSAADLLYLRRILPSASVP